MSQHIQHHHPQQPQYIHYAGPSNPPYIQNVTMMHGQPPQHHMQVLHYQPQGLTQPQPPTPQQVQQPQPVNNTPSGSAAGASPSNANGPLVAQGDWTKDLVQLAKQAELKNDYERIALRDGLAGSFVDSWVEEKFPASFEKHALALQLHTAHILSAHASLEQKSKAIQDIKEQKNKLESERSRLLKCLQEIGSDRDQADLAEAILNKECQDLHNKITQLSDGEYAIAKTDVDRLRTELGQPPLPSLQQTLQERTTQYLTERRLNGNEPSPEVSGVSVSVSASASGTPGPSSGVKRSAAGDGMQQEGHAKRPRGRPKGSKNKKATST